MKAAAKNEELVVWDENGNVIGSLTDNVPEGALETNPDGSVNTSFAFKSDVDRQGNEFIRLRVGNGGAAEFYSVTVTLDEAGNKVYNYNPIR